MIDARSVAVGGVGGVARTFATDGFAPYVPPSATVDRSPACLTGAITVSAILLGVLMPASCLTSSITESAAFTYEVEESSSFDTDVAEAAELTSELDTTTVYTSTLEGCDE